MTNKIPLGLSAYISQLKVEGELDYIALIPQGDTFDLDNAIKCKVLSAGNDPEKDVALIQTISKRMPTSDCTFINIKDSMDMSAHDYAVLFLTAPAVTISFSEKSSLRFLNNKFIYYLGRLSLPIYLSQLFVRQFIEPIKSFSPAVHTVIYVAAVIAVSIVSMLLTDVAVKLIRTASARRKGKASA